ncbi:helix-turn-helix domain-containing protein [Francisella philomiragia]|uniref:helix-turn-helix domain-containing protein n=1 Tax=Francisella philomiragia TaxID=28110 RepID=UPI001C9DC51F|nr:helix-turn-helix transcriptional regulator [Francisella philomiragia]MBY7733439.1 helix-turn-helix domain-containing protein [Francisella philomiragia]
MSLDKLKAKAFKNPEVKKEYDKLDWEFKLRNTLINMRKNSGLTQEQIAEKMGTSRSNVSRLERLSVYPTINTLEKYAEACGYIFDFKPKKINEVIL